tara:strand:+ start:3324 stop:3638 length:315 start_codon:yes stop_codon:yes gene_type:complete
MKISTIIRKLETLESLVSSNSNKAFTLLLYVMVTDPNPVYIAELVKLNKTSPMRTKKLLDALSGDGVVQVTVSPEDSRKREVTLTNKGRLLKGELESERYKIKN